MKPRRASLLLQMILLGSSVSPAMAAPTYQDRVEDYVVQPGDTIEDLTRRFLGDATFWEDNWKLNPQVRNPHRLRIGQVLRIIVERKVIAEAARVVEAVNQTEKMLQKPNWEPAATGDLLGSGQGLRTRERSTAELRFNTESSLRLDEFSQVFLSRKETTLRGVDRGSITVERGAVDLRFAPLARSTTRIELVTGPSVARPSAKPDVVAEIRAGTASDGGARIMVFSGASEVAAAGEQVSVGSGMGTRVPQSGPPSPPEPLLPPPRVVQTDLSWNYSNGRLEWEAVPEAARYVLQVCEDEECSRPLQRHEITAPERRHQLSPLPVGSFHWRVQAVSATDLDGYPSTSASLRVSDATPDLEGPMLALRPVSNFVEAADGSALIGPEAVLAIDSHDERSGVARIELKHGAGEWGPLNDPHIRIRALMQSGEPVWIRAVDALDQVSPSLRVELPPG